MSCYYVTSKMTALGTHCKSIGQGRVTNMSQKEPIDWITVNGAHVPLYDGESKEQAISRHLSIIKAEKDKELQIAKNKEQADRLNGKIDHVGSYKKNFGIKLLNSEKIDSRFLSDSEKILSKMYKDIPVIPKNMTVEFKDFSKDSKIDEEYKKTWALSARNYDGAIYFNTNNLKNYDDAIKEYDKSIKSGQYIKGTTPASILAHEIGHKVEYAIAQKNGVDVSDLPKHQTARSIVTEAFKSLPDGMFKDMQSARNSISLYAGSSHSLFSKNDTPDYEETFAEALSDYYTNGNNANEFSKAIVKTMKERIK